MGRMPITSARRLDVEAYLSKLASNLHYTLFFFLCTDYLFSLHGLGDSYAKHYTDAAIVQ